MSVRLLCLPSRCTWVPDLSVKAKRAEGKAIHPLLTMVLSPPNFFINILLCLCNTTNVRHA